jgi:hypothetical protein
MGAIQLYNETWNKGEFLQSRSKYVQMWLDSEEFAKFGCGVACVIVSWYMWLLPLFRQLRGANCRAWVRCLQRV